MTLRLAYAVGLGLTTSLGLLAVLLGGEHDLDADRARVSLVHREDVAPLVIVDVIIVGEQVGEGDAVPPGKSARRITPRTDNVLFEWHRGVDLLDGASAGERESAAPRRNCDSYV